jgi:hypothetical protein
MNITICLNSGDRARINMKSLNLQLFIANELEISDTLMLMEFTSGRSGTEKFGQCCSAEGKKNPVFDCFKRQGW